MRRDYPGNDDDLDLWCAVYATAIVACFVGLFVYLTFG